MEEYTRKTVKFQCEQFTGHPHEGEFKIIGIKGITGYGSKLGYYDPGNGRTITIRPHDWIIKSEGMGVTTLTDEQFRGDYVKVVDSKQKVSNNKKASSSKTVDNEVI